MPFIKFFEPTFSSQILEVEYQKFRKVRVFNFFKVNSFFSKTLLISPIAPSLKVSSGLSDGHIIKPSSQIIWNHWRVWRNSYPLLSLMEDLPKTPEIFRNHRPRTSLFNSFPVLLFKKKWKFQRKLLIFFFVFFLHTKRNFFQSRRLV